MPLYSAVLPRYSATMRNEKNGFDSRSGGHMVFMVDNIKVEARRDSNARPTLPQNVIGKNKT